MAVYKEFSPRSLYHIFEGKQVGAKAWLLDEDPTGGRIIQVTLTDPGSIWCTLNGAGTGKHYFEPSRKVFLTLRDAVTQKRRWNRYITQRMLEGTWGWPHPCPVRPVIQNLMIRGSTPLHRP